MNISSYLPFALNRFARKLGLLNDVAERDSQSIDIDCVSVAQGLAPAVTLKNVNICYSDKAAIKNVNLVLGGGKVTSLVGPSGCGKSSLLAAINRLSDLQLASVTGKISIAEQDIFANDVSVDTLRKKVGMVFQKPNPFPMTIADNLRFPLREHGLKDKTELDRQVRLRLEEVGLWAEVKDRLNDSALLLSGGQQQRLCIARALSLSPKVLLLDEPCSALDPMATAVIEQLILNLRGRYTIFMVTHNLAQARRISDDVAVCWMNEGVGYVVESGTTDAIFTSPQETITKHYINGTLAGS